MLVAALGILALPGCEAAKGCRAERVDVEDAAVPQPVEAAPIPKLAKNQEILFVGGLMSELYEELSLHLEDEINAALQRSARSLNVHIPLPGDRSIDLAVGDAIAEALPRLEISIEPGRFISFYTQMRDFESEGIAYRNASLESPAFDTSDGVEHNARAILELLRSSRKQIIIVSHSKGSLDVLEALLDAPELWGKTVVGWVALQAPFHGSPLADPGPPSMHETLLRALGGNGQAVDDLKTSTRTAYMEAHHQQITDLTSRIPVITAYSVYETDRTVREFAGTFASGVFDPSVVTEVSAIVSDHYRASPGDLTHVIAESTRAAVALISDRISNASSAALHTIGIFTLTNAYLDDFLGLANDGLVPRESTTLPGAIHRQLDTGDHASPVMDVDPLKNFWPPEQRKRVTWELIHEVRQIAEDAAKRPAKPSKSKPR